MLKKKLGTVLAATQHAKRFLIVGAVVTAMLVPTGMALADGGEASTQDAPGLNTSTIEELYGIVPASTDDVPLRLDLVLFNTTAGSQLAKKMVSREYTSMFGVLRLAIPKGLTSTE